MSNRHSDIPMIDGQQQHRRASGPEDLSKKSFTHVRVLHNFRGANNDELCMKKDDVSCGRVFFGKIFPKKVWRAFIMYSLRKEEHFATPQF